MKLKTYLLSPLFYEKHKDCKEIEYKESRPYVVITIKINDNIFAIPFRTNMKHKYGYIFKNTTRKTSSHTGLDYTKAVIIKDTSYLLKRAEVDSLEYMELNSNSKIIIKGFTKYVNNYCKYARNQLTKYDSQKYIYSTLKYFHDELKI